MNGDLEKFVKENAPKGEETVTINMDGGQSW